MRLTIATAAALLASSALAGLGGASGGPCWPGATTTVLKNTRARVFRREGDPNRVLYGCSFAKKVVVPLDDPGDGFASFPRPALALAGNLVAYATDEATEQNQPGGTTLHVSDLTAENVLSEDRVSAPAGAQVFARVGSVVLRVSGGVAWISCPGRRYNLGSPAPSCLKPGHADSVYKIDAGQKKRTLLARGRQIDPRSLELRDGSLLWTVGGRRQHAPLR